MSHPFHTTHMSCHTHSISHTFHVIAHSKRQALARTHLRTRHPLHHPLLTLCPQALICIYILYMYIYIHIMKCALSLLLHPAISARSPAHFLIQVAFRGSTDRTETCEGKPVGTSTPTHLDAQRHTQTQSPEGRDQAHRNEAQGGSKRSTIARLGAPSRLLVRVPLLGPAQRRDQPLHCTKSP